MAVISILISLITSIFIGGGGVGIVPPIGCITNGSQNFVNNVENVNATLHANPFVILDSGEYLIISSNDDLEAMFASVMAELKERETDTVLPNDFFENFEREMRANFRRFNSRFFHDSTLVIAHVDSGSGNVNYTLTNLTQTGGTLTATITRNSPPINTMDFVNFVMFLELDSIAFNATSVVVNLV